MPLIITNSNSFLITNNNILQFKLLLFILHYLGSCITLRRLEINESEIGNPPAADSNE